MNMTDYARKANLEDNEKISFDYAYPQPWAEEIYKEINLWPQGIVWLYDKHAKIFGRPYPITLYGWIICRMMGWYPPTMEEI